MPGEMPFQLYSKCKCPVAARSSLINQLPPVSPRMRTAIEVGLTYPAEAASLGVLR